ncbi:MAG TPA: hypothetical protein VGL20_14860 [Candidatus Dormibacteraeota bacterium]
MGAVHAGAGHASGADHGPAGPAVVAATRTAPGGPASAVVAAPVPGAAPRPAVRTSDAPPAGIPASRAEIQDAGPLEADAYGLNLDLLATCLSCTSAQAGRNSSGGEGRELRLAGENVSEGQVPANGYANGAAAVVPSNSLLRLAVAGWDGDATATQSGSRAHTRGALLDLGFGEGGVVTTTVAESTSDAAHSGSASHASSQSNAARAGVGAGWIALVVLHSDGSSDAPGHTYLASVNGDEIGSSGTEKDDHGVALPRVGSVALLRGDGSGGAVASASDGHAQRVVGVGTTWVGSPWADPQPLR